MTLRPEAQRWLAHESNPRLCEAELNKVRSGCSPACFDCSCGRRWVHVCDEAEGCSWIPSRRVRILSRQERLERMAQRYSTPPTADDIPHGF